MGLEELATFVEAAERGSISKAAKALGVPKSTVSRRLARLEEELGHQLVQRHARLFRLTEAGELLLAKSASHVRELQRAQQFMTDGGDELAGRLAITVPQDLGVASGLVDVLARFRREHPEIQLTVDLTDRAVDLARDGVDFALRAHLGDLPDAAGLRVRRLGRLELGLYASPDYIERRGAPEEPEELLEHDVVAPRINDLHEAWTLTHAASSRTRRVAVSPGLEGSTLSFMLPAAVAGAGIAPLATFAARHEVERAALVRVLDGWTIAVATLSLLWPESTVPTLRRRALLDFLVEELELGESTHTHSTTSI